MRSETAVRASAYPSWVPYVAPLVVFLGLGALDDSFRSVYPVFYSVKILIVACVLAWSLPQIPEARPNVKGLLPAVAAGVLLCVLWVVVDRVTPHFAFLGHRVGFNPIAAIPAPAQRYAFLAVRFFGLVVVVPFIEEIFFRGFLLRVVTDPDDFRRVPVGTFSAGALAVNVLFMAAAHPEWLSAALFSAAICLLYARTRSLFACVAAHSVTNLALGIYVLLTHNWRYW
jgi:hypothetical protein